MVIFPNAKLNIGLSVTGRRTDGFHNIESCFFPVGWSDILEAVEANALSFESTGIPIPGDASDNLALKAYRLLKEEFDIPPVKIHLHKIIPIGAGLGGGSSDGAFMLKLLDRLFNLALPEDRLEKFALQLGSDCPFFIRNIPRFVSGRGEKFQEINLSLIGKHIVIVTPGIHVSTPEAYSGIAQYSEPGRLKNIVENQNLQQWRDTVKNDFEISVFRKYPQIEEVKKILYEKGALYASMTGSGASLFGIFDQSVEIKNWFNPEYSVWKGALL